jgi:hypothetical protein
MGCGLWVVGKSPIGDYTLLLEWHLIGIILFRSIVTMADLEQCEVARVVQHSSNLRSLLISIVSGMIGVSAKMLTS